MGDPKLLTRFREFCEAYKVEYAFEGVVDGFDTIDAVDPERLTRGLFVHCEERRRLVPNEPKRRPPVKIGDRVIVVGRDGGQGEGSMLPAVLFIPKEHHVFFFKALRIWSLRQALGYLFYMIFIIFIWFWPMTMADPPLGLLGMLIGLVLFIFTYPIDDYIMRPRLYQCDEQTWHVLIAEVAERFGIKPPA